MDVQPVTPQSSKEVFRQLAEIHRQEIHAGFLSTLGEKFLVTLYESLSGMESAFVIAAFDGDKLLGFIVGALDTGAVYKSFFRAAGARAFLQVAPKLFSLARLKRTAETLLYPKRKQDVDLPEPEILNFCVRSDTQGSGVGGKLFAALCEEFRRRGVSEIRIVTGESQESAQRFYEHKGATLAASLEVHKGAQSRVYVYSL